MRLENQYQWLFSLLQILLQGLLPLQNFQNQVKGYFSFKTITTSRDMKNLTSNMYKKNSTYIPIVVQDFLLYQMLYQVHDDHAERLLSSGKLFLTHHYLVVILQLHAKTFFLTATNEKYCFLFHVHRNTFDSSEFVTAGTFRKHDSSSCYRFEGCAILRTQ